ncbi:uncharacterized protein C8Q71DRAFT_710657 [Rhodofomes roseus]|uniref:Nucleotidyltransferase-like protein n=1 Tax=Rhodofomes roseus TaxID=34475 RepID=A0ABQ8KBT1_9APHY|nr:uncharacterized protein C8Q71DRAFT_710657 [Rhodofomes roseus]KAH9835006.1 hypothetical protein C8Q71DRAFT_710657 [Rhodofomes roseus]
MRSPPTYGEICDIANRAVTIFTECGYQCCLFGSTACALYGVTRCPNDVDLVVLATPNTSTEYLKQLLVNEPNDFYLVPSKKRDANYKVLWYRLPPGARGKKRKCKVDVLVPGMLNIPAVPSAQVAYARHLPVMPLLPLLLLKLQGWTDHRDSDRRDFRRKQHVDVEDVKELLSFACDLRVRIGSRELGWLPADFVEAAQNRIHEFVGEFPESVLRWRSLGFEAF